MNIKGINKKVNDKVILNDISLEFDETGIVFVMGKSGAGKTSLFNVMSGIDSEYEGEVTYTSDENLKNVEWYRRNVLGIVFQDFNLIGCLNVRENILLGIKISGKEFNEEKYDEIISMLDIREIQDRNIANLSGGEKQRVAIARALLRDDKIIFADEPSGNLDEKNTNLLFSYIKKISRDRLFIIITHDGAIAREFGDRIIEISDGKVISDERIADKRGSKLDIAYDDSKNKNKNGWIVAYSIRNFWQRRRKTVGIALITTLALLCIMFILGFKSSIDNLFYEIDRGVLENDKFLYYEMDDSGYKTVIDSDVVETLEQKDNIENYKLFYEEEVNVVSGSYEEQITFDIVDNSDFYKERYKDIEGELPKNSSEVMIDEILAKNIFGDCESYTRKKFMIVSAAGIKKEVTVTAVKLVSSKDEGELYISDELSKEIMVSNYEDALFVGKDDSEEAIIMGRVYAEEEIILGRKPESDNEIVICDVAVNEVGEIINQNGTLYSIEDIQGGKVCEQLRKTILDKTVNLYTMSGVTNIGEFKIVGIYKSDEEDIGANICFEKGILNRSIYNKANIYLNDISDESISDLEGTLKSDGNSYLERYSQGKSRIIQSKVSIVIIGLVALTVIIIIMAAMMVHFFVKLSIYERHYEIGVLLSLGMNIKVIRRILLIEQLILSFCISALTMLVVGIVKVFNIDDYCVVEGVRMYNFEYWHLISIVIFSGVFIIVSSYPNIVASTKKNIVGLLTQKQG